MPNVTTLSCQVSFHFSSNYIEVRPFLNLKPPTTSSLKNFIVAKTERESPCFWPTKKGSILIRRRQLCSTATAVSTVSRSLTFPLIRPCSFGISTEFTPLRIFGAEGKSLFMSKYHIQKYLKLSVTYIQPNLTQPNLT